MLSFEWHERTGQPADRLSLLSGVGYGDPHHFRPKSDQDRIHALRLKEETKMREEYDFSNARPNPYAKKLKSQVTINLDVDTIAYFKQQAASSGIPYQTLINLYLADCVRNKRQLNLSWS